MKIFKYCKKDLKDWELLNEFLTKLIFPNDEGCCFIRPHDGVQFLASLKSDVIDGKQTDFIHASLTPLESFRKGFTKEEHSGHIFDISTQVLDSFFPNRKFSRLPDAPSATHMKHYMSVIESNDVSR